MKTTTTTELPKLLLKPKEAADVLSISERTLAKLTKDGDVPSVKLGGSRRYCLADLQACIDQLQADDADQS